MPALPPSGDPSAPVIRRMGARLPHWTREGAIYHVTFRQGDSVPADVADRWRRERDAIIERAAQMGRGLADHEAQRLLWLHREKIEDLLDSGAGSCVLREPGCARIVQDAMFFFDAARYHMIAWCVMPNHVHVVFQPMSPYTLPAIMHSWKSFTSNEINKTLGRRGMLWQAEYYDHLVRDEEDLQRCIAYVIANPHKAGLIEWPWVGFRCKAQ